MAPKRQAKSAPAQESTSDYTSLDASQSQDHQAAVLEEAGRKNRLKTQQRREQQKKEILANHQARQDRLMSDIEEALEVHDEEVRLIRQPKIERLIELAERKRVLEEQIEKCESELDQMFFSTANQLLIVLEGRIELLSE